MISFKFRPRFSPVQAAFGIYTFCSFALHGTVHKARRLAGKGRGIRLRSKKQVKQRRGKKGTPSSLSYLLYVPVAPVSYRQQPPITEDIESKPPKVTQSRSKLSAIVKYLNCIWIPPTRRDATRKSSRLKETNYLFQVEGQ
jgi:hypothetical protein